MVGGEGWWGCRPLDMPRVKLSPIFLPSTPIHLRTPCLLPHGTPRGDTSTFGVVRAKGKGFSPYDSFRPVIEHMAEKGV